MKYDVICVGSATIDLFLKIDRKFAKCMPGDKILMDDLNFATGGGGTNSAVALSRLNCKTAYLGKLGEDHNARKVIKKLEKEKVDILPVTPSSLRTSFSVIIESKKEKDKQSYTFKGASNTLKLEDFNMKSINAHWLYVATNLGKSCKTTEKIAEYAKKKGTKILFNPSSYMAKEHNKIKRLLQLTDILVLNKNEARILTKTKKQPEALSELLFEMGPKIVIITDGENGVYYNSGLENYKVKAKKTKVVSVAGAGDAFTSGFLAGLIKKKDILTSIKIGIENATSVLKHLGTKNKLLTWKEVTK